VRYLNYYNVKFQPTNKYSSRVKFIYDIQPSYVYIEDEEFLKQYNQPSSKRIIKNKEKIMD